MNLAYFDCSSGVSGDMIVGSLIDCGLKIGVIRDHLKRLKMGPVKISANAVGRAGLTATKFSVETSDASERPFSAVKKLIGSSALPEPVKTLSLTIFHNLAEAEARVHGQKIDDVHFHEVGAVDSIVDVIASAAGLNTLGLTEVHASRLTLGRAAPATLELLRGVPVEGGGNDAELTTPTGAAITKTVCKRFGLMPAMKIRRTGAGAGAMDPPNPNVVRLTIGEPIEPNNEQVCLIETNLDNMNPQLFGHVMEKLLEAGALDVWFTGIQMKKGRPGLMLSCIAEPALESKVAALLLTETDTLGIRITQPRRIVANRKLIRVNTKFGPVSVKVGEHGGKTVSAMPEYEDCRRIAGEENVPLKAVFEEAKAEALREIED